MLCSPVVRLAIAILGSLLPIALLQSFQLGVIWSFSLFLRDAAHRPGYSKNASIAYHIITRNSLTGGLGVCGFWQLFAIRLIFLGGAVFFCFLFNCGGVFRFVHRVIHFWGILFPMFGQKISLVYCRNRARHQKITIWASKSYSRERTLCGRDQLQMPTGRAFIHSTLPELCYETERLRALQVEKALGQPKIQICEGPVLRIEIRVAPFQN